jgi:4-carboxymuconolactone decarboxylase
MDDALKPLKARGDKMRRKVLGRQVRRQRRQAAVNFGADFQEVVTAFAWGGVWSREGLSLRDRSLITIAVLRRSIDRRSCGFTCTADCRTAYQGRDGRERWFKVACTPDFPRRWQGNKVGQAFFGDLEAAGGTENK